MKLIFYPIIALLVFSSVADAQKLQRTFSFGNNSNQYGRKIGYDLQGNMFVAGSFEGANMDVDPSSGTFNLSSTGDYDVFIAKYDPYGIFLNAIKIGGTNNDQATSVAVDSLGNVYITGWFRGTVDFDPSNGVANVVSNGHSGNDLGYNGEIFLAKYDNNLAYKWAFGIGGTYIDDAGLAVKIDRMGDVILAGDFRGTNVDFNPSPTASAPLSAAGVIESFVAKYTSAGNYVWAKGIGGATTVSGQVRDIAIDSRNNIFAVGHFDGSVDLDPGTGTNPVTSAGCGDIYLLKLSSAGEHKWGFKIGGSACDYPVSVVLDPNDNAYISGYFASSNVDFNPGSGVNTLSSTGTSYDIFMAKYDSAGAYVFAQKAGGTGHDIGYDMAIRSDGFVLVGYFSKTVDFDPSPTATSALTSANDSTDGFIAHYTFDGQYVSAFRIGSTGDDAVYGIYADAQDVISVTGYFNHSNVDFDPSSTKYYLSNNGQNDVFIAKYYDIDVKNIVKGTIFLDKNLNGTKESDEPYYPGGKLISIKANEDTVVTISSNGKFAFGIDTGQYITRAIPYAPYYTVAPASDTTTFTSYMNSDSVSFAVQPIAGIKDLAVAAIPLTPARPGFPVRYQLYYYNKGTDTIANGYLEFKKDSRLTFDSASVTPTSVSGDTLRWTYTNFAPRTFKSIITYLRAATPPTLLNSDTLVSVAKIYPVDDDSTEIDNVAVINHRVVGSYDPNDKREIHGGKISLAKVAEGEYLQYTIRFQNTGTDTAFNVIIRDTLNSKLDWASMEMLTASHDYSLTIADGNKCSWEFTGINLVDSNANEPLSHGYIVFRIKAKTTVVAGDIITNKASIYFDYNLPVETNIEQTVIVSSITLPLKLISFTARREAKINHLNWITVSEVNTSHFEIERSDDARLFTVIGRVNATGGQDQVSYDYIDQHPEKGINYYRLRIVDKDGKIEYSPVRKIDNTPGLYATVYPNPVKDILTVFVSLERKDNVSVEIFGVTGSRVALKQMLLAEGSSNIQFNVSNMPAGTYFVRVSIGNEQTWIQFIK